MRIVALITLISLVVSCQKDEYKPPATQDTPITSVPGNGVTDIEGGHYGSIILGNGQEWMTENLRVTKYSNGDNIMLITSSSSWIYPQGTGFYSYINNGPWIYGKLYNFNAVKDSRKIAPAGWHIPTKQEWRDLENYLYQFESEAEPFSIVGGKLKSIGTSYWLNPNESATNLIGFSALPGGYRNGDTGGLDAGEFTNVGKWAYFWSSTATGPYDVWFRGLCYGHGQFYEGKINPDWGLSVRCIKD